jgi:hypothetical protein
VSSILRPLLILAVAVVGLWFVSKEFGAAPDESTVGGITCEIPNVASGPPELLRWREGETKDASGAAGPKCSSYEAVLLVRGVDGLMHELARSGRITQSQWTLDKEVRSKVPKHFRFEVNGYDTAGKLLHRGTCECQRP